MATDLELIKQLEIEVEKQIGRKLKKYSMDDKQKRFDSFTIDLRGNVIEIRIANINKMDTLLPILLKFQHMKSLFIADSKLEDISSFKALRRLIYLYLNANQISDLSSLKELKELKELYLWRNQISDISSLNELKKLKELYLSENQISDISCLNELKGLEKLFLYNNQISDITSLNELKELKELYLFNNQINDLSSLLELKNLIILDLGRNKIKHLPVGILDLGLEIKWERTYKKHETGLFLAGNPLESPPPEIVKKGTKAVREYFKALEGEQRALREVKVLLVGDGAAGKTSLVKCLRGLPYDKNESQTHGINIAAWETAPDDFQIHVRIWDFGGQEIMHATHQFFLSKRSLYILVLDGRKDEKTEYWLNHVQTFGGASPLLVVLNKMDENPGFDVNRRFLKEKYPFIKGFYPVSCATGDGIDAFKKALDHELATVELIRTTWAKHWFKVKTRLENMKDHYISYDRYRDICREENIPAATAQDTLVDFLNDLGVILHFRDFHLVETQVLEPRWITTAVYKIINSPLLASGHGVLHLKSLKEILKPVPGEEPAFHYPADKYPYIIQMMKKFELCYGVEEDRILVPDLLSVAEPPLEIPPGPVLAFYFRYPFLPKSIMPRFLVKRHQDIKGELRWRTGVVLENKDCEALALVKADEGEQTIRITVTGTRKRDYFAVIRNTFREIHESFEKLAVEEWIPLPDNEKVAVEYRELLGYEKEGIDRIFIGKLGKYYDVAQLLSGIEKPEARRIWARPVPGPDVVGLRKMTPNKSFSGVQGAGFQKSPLAAGGIKSTVLPPGPIPPETTPAPAQEKEHEKEKKKRFPLVWKIVAGIGGLIAFLSALATVTDSQTMKKIWAWLTAWFK